MRSELAAVSARRRNRVAVRAQWERSLPIIVWGLSLAVFIALWSFVSSFYPPALLPSPTRTFGAMLEAARSGVLARHAEASLGRVLAGFILGAGIGMILGLVAGCIQLARLAFDPYVNFLRFVPAVSLLTPFVVWFGIGEMSKVFLIVFATLFIVMLNTIAGVDDVPVNRMRAGRMLGADSWQLFALIIFPSALPYVVIGMRIAMGVSFASIIVAEMVSADTGLGFLLSYARVISATDLQFVTILCLGVLGWGTDKIFQLFIGVALKRFR
jgi:NitT/TauT family transport system permease protein